MSEPTRRAALCAVIGSFSGGGQEPEVTTPKDIPDADTLRTDMVKALGQLHYQCTVLDVGVTAEQLGAAVEEFLNAPAPADGVRIVHVLSHGVPPTNFDGLRVLGADGREHKSADVGRWLQDADEDPAAPATLFLLDVCRAGTGTQLPHQLTIKQRRTVVLAASAADEPAYDANFTRALVTALGKVADGGYNVARGFQCVDLELVARDVQAMVEQYGHGQQVRSSLFSLLDDVRRFPFFPNLKASEADELPAGVDRGVGDLALGLDPAHFVDRAYAPGPFPRMATGWFQGRERLLRRLSAWLDGTPPATDPGEAGAGLRVVTGSPGSGKSALLGVLVCAAHPKLRIATDPAWNRLPHPSRNDRLVAVHARQLTTQQIIDSLARQLHLPPPSVASPDAAAAEPGSEPAPLPPADAPWARAGEGWSVQELLTGIAQAPVPPVIVLDALDEAAQPADVIQRLLLPLAQHATTGPAPAAGGKAHTAGGGFRLLVGTRWWEQPFGPLLQAARDCGGLINLDDEPTTEVRDAITAYVTAILTRQDPYDTAAYAASCAAFAEALATALVPDTSRPRAAPPPGDPGDQQWGAFLVAALYTHHKVTARALTPDPAQARARGQQVPRTLPQVMEMDLESRGADPWARPLLAAMAFARGNGMPLDTLLHVAPVFHPGGPNTPSPTVEQARASLRNIRFYLRLTPDSHGVICYRLFHQGLTDHLRAHPLGP